MSASILIVEDDPGIQKTLRQILEGEGFLARTASCAEDAFAALRKAAPDLILLDVRLPGMDGFDFCRTLRETPEWRPLAVIFLTSKDLEAHKILGLGLGADDYVTKPFSGPELTARIKAVLRRRFPEAAQTTISDGPVSVDRAGRTARLDGAPLKLTPTQFDLLALLMSKRGKVLTRSYLMESVWGKDYVETTRTIDTHIYNLRKALGKAGARVLSVGARGYKWDEPGEST